MSVLHGRPVLIALAAAAAMLGLACCFGRAAPPVARVASEASQLEATSPVRVQPYHLDSGSLHYQGAADEPVFRSTISIPDAAWLRVRFKAVQLGELSYLTIASLQDGSQQRLDSISLAQWRNTSAFFNGGAVEVALHAAPGDESVSFLIEEILVGAAQAGRPAPDAVAGPASICGAADGRVRSNHRAVGRTVALFGTPPITTAWCTGWIIANGAYLTAGHCNDPEELEILEFNVPSSLADGTPVFATANDQYAVVRSRVTSHNTGMGDDWTVFDVYPNSNTDLLPVYTQTDFIRLALPADALPANVRVTGYGLDGPAPLFGDGGGPQNSDNQTQQTHSGSFVTETYGTSPKVSISYVVDTQPANSGSPITHTGNNTAIGIHTNGGCTSTGGSNSGTSFANTDLARTIRMFPGWPTIYVDNGHPGSAISGDIFRPWPTVGLGDYFAGNGDTLSIVKGSYNEAITITKAITLTAPVGMVTIGQ